MIRTVKFLGAVFLALFAVATSANAENSSDEALLVDDNAYSRIIAKAQHIATAGDLRSIRIMLDYEYLKKGRYPKTENFAQWMETAFYENNLKELTTDHWGSYLHYRSLKNSKAYVLISCGSDGRLHTEDDLKITGP